MKSIFIILIFLITSCKPSKIETVTIEELKQGVLDSQNIVKTEYIPSTIYEPSKDKEVDLISNIIFHFDKMSLIKKELKLKKIIKDETVYTLKNGSRRRMSPLTFSSHSYMCGGYSTDITHDNGVFYKVSMKDPSKLKDVFIVDITKNNIYKSKKHPKLSVEIKIKKP